MFSSRPLIAVLFTCGALWLTLPSSAVAETVEESDARALLTELLPDPANVRVVFKTSKKDARTLKNDCKEPCSIWYIATKKEFLVETPISTLTEVVKGKSTYFFARSSAAVPAPLPSAIPAASASSVTTTTFTDLKSIAEAYDARLPGATAESPYKAQSADVTSAAAEAAQILGQIVVDRASAAALELAKDKLSTWFACKVATSFPQTCAAIAAVRLADLAVDGRALVAAVLQDLSAVAIKRFSAAAPKAAAIQCAASVVAINVVPAVVRAMKDRSSRDAAQVVERLAELALQSLKAPPPADTCGAAFASDVATATAGQVVVALASTAYARCVVQAKAGAGSLEQCAIGDFVRANAALAKGSLDNNTNVAAAGREAVVARAETLAGTMLDALTLKKGLDPDWRERARRAFDAYFDTTCLLVGSPTELNECPSKFVKSDSMTATGYLSDVRYLFDAALDEDVNALLVAGSAFVDDEAGKGLRILGALLKYARTYTDQKLSADDAHANRTKILEDFTQEMADRTGREGDWVASFGGSLRFVSGVRTWKGDSAFYGPIGLPLGFGLQKVSSAGGLHLEVDILELGHYVAYDNGGKVHTPELSDALAPSVTIGAAFGRFIPFFLGVTGSYAPHFKLKGEDTTSPGALNVGVVLGAYVPLLDLN